MHQKPHQNSKFAFTIGVHRWIWSSLIYTESDSAALQDATHLKLKKGLPYLSSVENRSVLVSLSSASMNYWCPMTFVNSCAGSVKLQNKRNEICYSVTLLMILPNRTITKTHGRLNICLETLALMLTNVKGATSRYFGSFLRRPKLGLRCWET